MMRIVTSPSIVFFWEILMKDIVMDADTEKEDTPPLA